MEDSLRLKFIARFETGLNTGAFIFEVVHTPRTTDQTECLFHCITHGCECEAIGTVAVSDRWVSVGRADSEI